MTSALFLIAAVVAVIARTIVWEEIFREVREWLTPRLPRKLAYLLTCDYCSSHWVALVVVPLIGYEHLYLGWVGTYFAVAALAVTYLSAFQLLRVVINYIKHRQTAETAAVVLSRKHPAPPPNVAAVRNCRTCGAKPKNE